VFVWDEKKREANLLKHKLDFNDAHYVFNAKTKVQKKLWIQGRSGRRLARAHQRSP